MDVPLGFTGKTNGVQAYKITLWTEIVSQSMV